MHRLIKNGMYNHGHQMRKVLAIAIIFLSIHEICGQTPVGSWSDHLSYNKANSIAAGTKQIFVSTGASLLVYDKEFAELRKMTRINGLTETEISAIGWSEENNALIIGYQNTNVDLLINSAVFNIPDIYNKYQSGDQEIHRIRTRGKYAYMACSFGIVVIDLSRKEIYDTWKPGTDAEDNEVWDISFGNDNAYAATASGVFSAALNDQGLSYFGSWDRINALPDPAGKYTSLIFSADRLFACKSDPQASGDSLFVIGSSASLFSYNTGVFINSIDPGTGGFTVSEGSSAKYFNPSGSLIKTISGYGFASPYILQSIADNGDIWIADMNSGLIKGEGMNSFSVLIVPGPVSDNVFHISSGKTVQVICGGGTDNSWNALGREYQVSLFDDNKWTYLTDKQVNDAVRSLIDPGDESHLFISSWGGGLLEYKDKNLVHHYTDANSPLLSIVPGKAYIRIMGLAMDRNKNLWITQSGVPGSIKVLKPDGGWIINPVTIDAPVIGDMIITRAGYKWIVLPGGHGLFILDDNNTPGNFPDDRYKQIVVRDADNQIISNVYSIAEDLDGNIWIGTDQGPLVYYTPERVFDEDLKALRIKVPRNDGSGLSDYLLKTETVTSIAVDGANRKWLGTSGSGAYQVSPDGTQQAANFTVRNSPILSDSIIFLAVDNKSGDIWFGTSRGLQSYRGNATAGAEKFTSVYAFPNPVRENFTGNLTITGLMKNTQVNITDISGNLVYETISDGGQATWDLKTYNGKRVSTGVYLIFCASSDGTETFVTKVLVIR
jgi:TSS9, PorZ, N-terminal beta-propeller domain/Two component regulator propeller